jgi:hypothetical protein
MEITNQIIGQLKEHFAKEWNVTSDKVHLGREDISIKGEEFYLEFTIDWGGTWETYWGEITYSELIAWSREETLKKIGI